MALWRSHFIAVLLLVATSVTGGSAALRSVLSDWRFASQVRQPTGQVVVLAIDSNAIESVGVWPWPRSVYANALERLQALGVTEVAFDIDFSSRSSPESDAQFRDQLEQFGGAAIIPVFKQLSRDASGQLALTATQPLPEFAAQSWLGAVNVTPEHDGRVRRYPYGEGIGNTVYPSFAALLTGRYMQPQGLFLVDFAIDARKMPIYSLADLMRGTIPREAIAGKKVIIGATAIELGDRFSVPVFGILPGAVLQGLAAESLLQDRGLQEPAFIIALGGLILIGVSAWLLQRRHYSAAVVIGVLVLTGIAIEGTAHIIQARFPYVPDTSLWLIALAGYVTATLLSELNLRSALATVAQRKFQSIAVSLGDGIICTNAAGRVTFWNPAAEAIFGISAGDAIGKPIDQFVAADDHGTFQRLLETGTSDQDLELAGVRSDGTTFPLEMRVSAWQAEHGRHHSFIVRDITSRKKSQERIRFLALHDALTGLPNRTHLCDVLRERIETNRLDLAVLLLDLDNFKEVNDKLGHDGGDILLKQFAGELRSCLSSSDFVARLGGDEFAVIADLTNGGLERVVTAISGILGEGNRYTYLDGRGFLLSTSIGSARFPEDGTNVDDLLSHSDLALYRAKKAGRGLHISYDKSFKDVIEHRRQFEAELREALEREELEIFFQPQVRLADGQLTGVETLLRWRHPVRGVMQPAEFLSVLSTSTLSVPAGEYILRTSCAKGAAWYRAGHHICVGVNLFPSQLTPELPGQIAEVLADTGLPAHLLEIEITENILLNDDETTIALLASIRRMGVRVALDDFGTGFASLTHLKRFPLDRLKIDRSFVTTFGSDRSNTAIVTAILALGHDLDLNIIAEGIEDADCAALLRAAGCDDGQGYHFGRPMMAADVDRLLAPAAPTAASNAA